MTDTVAGWCRTVWADGRIAVRHGRNTHLRCDILWGVASYGTQRDIFDTSVIVAGLRSRLDASNRLLELVAEERLIPLVTTTLFLECQEVLRRLEKRLVTGIGEKDIAGFMAALASAAEPVAVHEHLQVVRDRGAWEEWPAFFLRGVIEVAAEARAHRATNSATARATSRRNHGAA